MGSLIPRQLEQDILKLQARKEIIGLRGARQAGKTTLLKMLEKKISGRKAFINCDLVENRRALEEAPLDFVRRFQEGEKLTLFLDEIQRVENAGEKLKILYDECPQLKIFISGSSSLELKAKVLPALVGRLLLFELYTFDFSEFLRSKEEGLWKVHKSKRQSLQDFLQGKGEPAPPSFQDSFLRYWKEYVLFGGYPEVAVTADYEEKKVVLQNIFNLYIEKDITAFFRIEETNKFVDFVKSASFSIAQLAVLSSFASTLHLPYAKAEEFLEILRHTYVIALLKPFHRNMITELKKAPKIYFLDLGLRNMALNNFLTFDNRSDRGQILENFVFRQLSSTFPEYQQHFWRTTAKAEVDFILSKDQEIIPLEVKLSGENPGRSFHSFLQTYQPRKALVITLNTFARKKIGNTLMYFVPAYFL